MRSGAPFDAFGVGTQLATSFDAPALSAVYKLVELKRDGVLHYTAKFSDEKSTLPGAKQIYRYADHDVLALYSECNSDFQGMPLVRPVMSSGKLVEALPALPKSRSDALAAIAALPEQLHSLTEPASYPVDISSHLVQLAESIRDEVQVIR